ncbi:MAG: hypothetical protein V1678_00125 [Candidatus Aenigmatarchaeota archaeon]
MDEKEVKKVLDDLQRLEDVQACEYAERGVNAIMPNIKLRLKDIDLWNLISETTDKFFEIATNFYEYGVNKIYFEIGDYDVILTLIEPTIGLLVIIPTLANRGLLEVEIENARRQIVELRKE